MFMWSSVTTPLRWTVLPDTTEALKVSVGAAGQSRLSRRSRERRGRIGAGRGRLGAGGLIHPNIRRSSLGQEQGLGRVRRANGPSSTGSQGGPDPVRTTSASPPGAVFVAAGKGEKSPLLNKS